MKQFIVNRHTTPNTPTLEQVPTDKIPLYPTEQDLLDDLANLEVGQIVGTIDPAESELIGTLIQRIQALESKLESDDVYSTDEVKTNKKILINGVWKDVYRKCFTGVIASNTVLLQNVLSIVNVGGMYTDADNVTKPFPLESYDQNCRSVRLYTDNTLKINCQYSNQNYKIWIEYTKITED